MWRTLALICTVAGLVGLFLIPLNPVNSKLLKLAFLGSGVIAWIGFAVLVQKPEILRIFAFFLPVMLAIPVFLPGGKINADELREDYLRRMAEFEGTKYLWGGESDRGIDCSGLPRRALRDALRAYGFRHANGKAFRAYLEQWWFDASARALGEGYRDYTKPLGIKGIIREIDHGRLDPGDLAVTVGGVHVLAYAGDGKWIQADPGIRSVATLDGKKDDNGWFRIPVTIHRWRVLDQDIPREPRHLGIPPDTIDPFSYHSHTTTS